MDVSRRRNALCLDHTKYVGRSSDHAVSTGPDDSWHDTEKRVVQNNVELSEDGERLID
jgi:hypothetical protein